MIEPLALHPDLTGLQVFRLERTHLEGIVRPRAEAAAAEARGVLNVSEHVLRELVLEAGFRRGLAGLDVHRRVRNALDAVEPETIDHGVLLVLRIPHAERATQLVREVIDAVHEACVVLGRLDVEVRERRGAQIRNECGQPRGQDREALVRIGGIVVKAAHGPVEALEGRAGEGDFLAELVMVARIPGHVERHR